MEIVELSLFSSFFSTFPPQCFVPFCGRIFLRVRWISTTFPHFAYPLILSTKIKHFLFISVLNPETYAK